MTLCYKCFLYATLEVNLLKDRAKEESFFLVGVFHLPLNRSGPSKVTITCYSCRFLHFYVPTNHSVISTESRYSGSERNGPESPKAQVSVAHVMSPTSLHGQVQHTREMDSRQSRTASTATKELDDLMASLSDFKVNVSAAPTPSQARLSGDYAKPNKPIKPQSPGKSVMSFRIRMQMGNEC